MNEQAGIYAGDEGYDINVNKHTDLKGALITSTQKAEEDGKNHFSTSSLTHSDIENHSNYSGSSFGVSGSVSANFETPFGENGAAQSTKQATDKDGNLLYTDKNGNTTVNSKGVNGQENTKKLAEGKESLQFSYGMGYGKDSDSQSSTTKSGINTQNIIIKDEAEQLKRTGKTVQEEIAAIKTDITIESAPSQSGKLENRFNKDDVQKELDFQREVTEKFGPNVAEAGSLLANKFGEEAKAKRHEAAIALEEAEKAKAENNNETNRALVKQARDNFETASREAKEWETGGNQRLIIDSALNVISTALAGRPAAEVVASGLSPAVNNQIKKATTDAKGNVNTALNLTAHALWGAVEAYAGNRNVAAGAAGAAGGEAAAHFLSSTLYNKSPENLSEEEKRTVSSLSQVAAGIAGGSLSDSSDGAIIAAKTAKDAVENNNFALDSVMNNPQVDWLANAKAQEKISEADRQAMEAFEKAHPDLVKNLKQTGDVASFVADFIPVAGDIKSFAEAEDGIDYALAFVGVVPGSEIIVKPLKAAKESIQKARVAEKLGNTADVIKHQKAAISYIDNSVNGFYDAKEFRKGFENTYGKNNVVSTTIPPNNAKNVKLAGKEHPKTGVPFDDKGYAIFDNFSVYDTRLNISDFREASYIEQMRMATRDLANAIDKGYVNKNKFTPSQLSAIYKGESKIPNFTWHHHQDTGRMQLVDYDLHKETGHIGWESMKNGK